MLCFVKTFLTKSVLLLLFLIDVQIVMCHMSEHFVMESTWLWIVLVSVFYRNINS